MAPVWGDFRQRPHDEQPFGRSRVRHDKPAPLDQSPPVGDQIKIQDPWSVGDAAAPTELSLKAMQRLKQRFRRLIGLNQNNGVQIVRLAWIGPGSGPPNG